MENFTKLTDAINNSKGGKNIGVFAEDSDTGEFCEAWNKWLETQKYQNVDISAAIAYTISQKEDCEIVATKKASTAAVNVFSKYLKGNIMDIIDSAKVIFSWPAKSK